MQNFKILNYKQINNFNLENLNKINIISTPPDMNSSSIIEAIILFHNPQIAGFLLPIFNDKFNFDYNTVSFNNAICNILKDPKDAIFLQSDIKKIAIHNGLHEIVLHHTEELFNTIAVIDNKNNNIYQPIELKNIDNCKKILMINEIGHLVDMKSIRKNYYHDCGNIYFNSIKHYDKSVIDKYLIPLLNLFQLNVKNITSIPNPCDDTKLQIGYCTTSNDNYFSFASLDYGARKAFNILLAIINCRDGILLIHDFENGIYINFFKTVIDINNNIAPVMIDYDNQREYGNVLKKVFQIMIELCNIYNCQIIMTSKHHHIYDMLYHHHDVNYYSIEKNKIKLRNRYTV